MEESDEPEIIAVLDPTDDDGDGVSVGDGDCDDNDSSVYPGAQELADGKDNDCNGSVDDGLGTPPAVPSAPSITNNCGNYKNYQ